MATKSLDTQIQNSLPLLGIEEKQSILGIIKLFLRLKNTPQPPQRLTIEQYNKELEEAEARMDDGHFIPMEDVLKEAESW